jgi:hypothetical protein
MFSLHKTVKEVKMLDNNNFRASFKKVVKAKAVIN